MIRDVIIRNGRSGRRPDPIEIPRVCLGRRTRRILLSGSRHCRQNQNTTAQDKWKSDTTTSHCFYLPNTICDNAYGVTAAEATVLRNLLNPEGRSPSLQKSCGHPPIL